MALDITSYLMGKKSGGGEINNQEKSATPTTSSQEITPDEGYTGLSKVNISAVTSSIDSNIVASNIKKDVSILGVLGTLEEGEEGIYKVATLDEMNAIQNPQPNDICVVYNENADLTGIYEYSNGVWNVIIDLPQLPNIYTQLDYIESTGTQYINTNINPKNTKVDIKYALGNNINVAYIGGVNNKGTREGKNKFNINGQIENSYNTTNTVSGTKLTVTGYYNCRQYIDIKPNTNYTVSCTRLTQEFGRVKVFDQTIKTMIAEDDGTTNVNFTFNSGNYTRITLLFYSGGWDYHTETAEYQNIQFEEGSSATDYEPYIGTYTSNEVYYLTGVNVQGFGTNKIGIVNKTEGILYTEDVDTNIHRLTYNLNLKAYYDDTNVGNVSNLSNITEYPLYLFADNYNQVAENLIKAKLYYCRIYEDNALIRELIPCKKKSNNQVGLYDLVNDVFYTNEGTGTFLYE